MNYQRRQGLTSVGIPRARPVCRGRLKAPTVLPRCSWQFCGSPDDTNQGPQITVTEPSGVSHYLVDLDTYQTEVRQSYQRQSGQVASYVETCRMAARTDAMSSFSFEEMDMYGEDDDPVPISSYTPGHSTRWWQRWGRMFLRSGTQPQPLLPLFHQTDSSFDPEKLTLLGYDGAQDGKAHHGDMCEKARPSGFAGALRSLACCCSKS